MIKKQKANTKKEYFKYKCNLIMYFINNNNYNSKKKKKKKNLTEITKWNKSLVMKWDYFIRHKNTTGNTDFWSKWGEQTKHRKIKIIRMMRWTYKYKYI